MKKLGKPERSLEKVEEWVEEIYTVLSVMPWSPRKGDGQLEALCEALWAARDGPLKEERILSSLLRPRCDALVSAYCSAALRLQRDYLLRNAPETQGGLSVFRSKCHQQTWLFWFIRLCPILKLKHEFNYKLVLWPFKQYSCWSVCFVKQLLKSVPVNQFLLWAVLVSRFVSWFWCWLYIYSQRFGFLHVQLATPLFLY